MRYSHISWGAFHCLGTVSDPAQSYKIQCNSNYLKGVNGWASSPVAESVQHTSTTSGDRDAQCQNDQWCCMSSSSHVKWDLSAHPQKSGAITESSGCCAHISAFISEVATGVAANEEAGMSQRPLIASRFSSGVVDQPASYNRLGGLLRTRAIRAAVDGSADLQITVLWWMWKVLSTAILISNWLGLLALATFAYTKPWNFNQKCLIRLIPFPGQPGLVTSEKLRTK